MFSPPPVTGKTEEGVQASSSGTLPTAAVQLENTDGHKVKQAVCGDGPVDAVFKAIERITGISPNVRDYQIRSVTTGEDAQGEAILETEYNSRIYRGRGELIDHIFASRGLLDPLPTVRTSYPVGIDMPSVTDEPGEIRNLPGSDHAAVVATFTV